MKLGVMQPYFFPYLGYFQLIARTDVWIVFDVVQYRRKSWMNRNRVLHPSRGWQYVGVPVRKAPRETPIREIRIADKDAALRRILGQLDHYRGHAPRFSRVLELLKAAFAQARSDRLSELNVAGLDAVCSELGLRFDWSLCSELDVDLGGVEQPGQWALELSKQLGASEYLNAPGGRDIFDPPEWERAGITLRFNEPLDFRYACAPYAFHAGLSILDVLMWNEPETIVGALSEPPR